MKYYSTFERVREASRHLNKIDVNTINEVLNVLADEVEKQTSYILAENQKDLARIEQTNHKYDRLKLTEDRIKGIANDIRNVARLPYPVGKVLEQRELASGLQLSKITVPLGVVGIIYEARPNVTLDCFALSFKSGNACILKGAGDAIHSNTAIVSVIKVILADFSLNTSICELLPAEREATQAMLSARGFVDVVIPRGGRQLIDFVVENSKVPIIETGAGIVHTYIDEDADINMAAQIVNNAKTRRVSVCNALDCLIINKHQLGNLAKVVSLLAKSNVILYADKASKSILTGCYPEGLLFEVTDQLYSTEFEDYKMSIKTVSNLDEAISHISKYSSKHSEAIISNNVQNIERFMNEIDAAVVYANASTAFTDGSEFGFGAEIGISTQKLHARGPMGLAELCSYKWMVRGNGQVRLQ
ncbi:MAG: glutamate-5-semialdehyde dehydrogenase [Bacteroidota bacterium]|nr:glutamate-5-semialdehyde dehydrogenase [Bacteroidota bacterium]